MTVTMPAYDANKLFEVLRAQGRRQDWLAAQVGCSQSLISMVKRGQRRMPDWFAERAAAALGVPADFFIAQTTPSGDTSAPYEDRERRDVA